jgi:hypothetical protein
MLPPRVLTVLPDYPLPATTGLHLRMVANIEAVNRLVAMGRVDGHDVLWFGTEERNSATHSAAPDSALTACDSVVHAAGRVEQHTMSAVRLASSKVCYGLAGSLGQASATYPFSMRCDATLPTC